MNAIECDNLTKRFGRTLAVDRLTLQVPTGSIFALLGSNGAGKSTTLKLLLNLMRPTSGRATVLGAETTRFRKEHFRRVGYVAEDQKQPDWMTLRQYLGFYRPFYPTWDEKLERELTVQYALPNDRPLKKLSRGMRMKAVLLSTLCFRPELLLLDEPFSGLDPEVRDDLIDGLLEAAGGPRASTVVISSHDIAEVERVADWVGILAAGRLVVAEPVAQLQARFRRIEVVGPGVGEETDQPCPSQWLAVQRPGPNVLQFVDSGYSESTRLEDLRYRFPQATVRDLPLSLREIFLLHSRTKAAESGKALS